MNFFKNTIPLIILFCINSSKARVGSSAKIQPQPKPVTVVKQPNFAPSSHEASVSAPSFAKSFGGHSKASTDTQEKSYKDLVNYIKKSSNAWDRTNAGLNLEFIYDMMQKAQHLKLDNDQFESLLQTARDVHGVFTGNQAKDKNILITIEAQIQAALTQRQNL
jgi:hypothetical protein